MRLCRYDDDRLGVVRGGMVHDVTPAQTQIRAAAPYAMKGDAVIAALPAWRARIEEMASKSPGKPLAEVKLLSPVARPSKLVAAPTNYKAHIEEMAARAVRRISAFASRSTPIACSVPGRSPPTKFPIPTTSCCGSLSTASSSRTATPSS